MSTDRASAALSRFTVLDLTRARSGPTAVRQLADWGANVIKIELPDSAEGDDGIGGMRSGPDFQNLHRNKRGVTLDLKTPDGIAVFKRMADKADVIVENFGKECVLIAPNTFNKAHSLFYDASRSFDTVSKRCGFTPSVF